MFLYKALTKDICATKKELFTGTNMFALSLIIPNSVIERNGQMMKES